MSLLEVVNLTKTFKVGHGGRARRVQAVRGVSFSMEAGETLGVVGESGSGKSTTARLVLNLIKPDDGQVRFRGESVLEARGGRLRALRRQMPMVFQDPYSSLDPMWLIGDIISEPLAVKGVRPEARRARVLELLDSVGLPAAFASRYTYELSGGQRQRVAIARALACDPEILICDEALSALDVSTQARTVQLLEELKRSTGVANLFVAHDLSMVRAISDRIAVMYLGRIVEYGPTAEVYKSPAHPYSQALTDAVPRPDPVIQKARERIKVTGEIPSASSIPEGCSFRARCLRATAICEQVDPTLTELTPGRSVACHNPLVQLPTPALRYAATAPPSSSSN